MTTPIHDRRQDLEALGPHLLAWASALTRDASEARALVQETLLIADDPANGPADSVSTQVWIHRLLRRSFHSVERDRSYRRSTSAAVTELGYARKRALLARAQTDAENGTDAENQAGASEPDRRLA
jgi:DNA-directed RNA polymerase specialized sigma24 family protein